MDERVWRALALRMGYPLALLKRLMTHREFIGWRNYFLQEPFDDARCFDLPGAQIRHLYINSHKAKGDTQVPLADLLPFMPAAEKEELDMDALVMSRL